MAVAMIGAGRIFQAGLTTSRVIWAGTSGVLRRIVRDPRIGISISPIAVFRGELLRARATGQIAITVPMRNAIGRAIAGTAPPMTGVKTATGLVRSKLRRRNRTQIEFLLRQLPNQTRLWTRSAAVFVGPRQLSPTLPV